jgi:hypothetical protein
MRLLTVLLPDEGFGGEDEAAKRRSSDTGKKTALAMTMASRPWRLRFREVVREVEEGVAVRFPSSAGRAAVHGDGGGRRFCPSRCSQ